MAFAQESELIIVAQSYDDLRQQIVEVKNKEAVKKLAIILQRSRDHWYVMPIIGGKYDYEHPTFTIQDPISKLPSEIWQFNNVEFLDISTLGLSSLSDSLLNMTELRTLNISENYLNIEENVPLLLKLSALKTLVAFSCPVSQIAITYLKDAEENIDFLYTNSDYAAHAEEYFKWKTKYINLDSKEVFLLEMLDKVQSYYPIGLGYYNGIYPGYKKLEKILRDEAELANYNYEATKIAQLKNALHERYPSLEVVNSTSATYMASSVSIRLQERKQDGISEVVWMRVSASNLTNHFIVYLESTVFLNNYIEFTSPISYKVLRGKKNASTEETKMMDSVISMVEAVFPDHQFADHYLLMTKNVEGGLPHGQGTDVFGQKFPISSFLFGITPPQDSKVIR